MYIASINFSLWCDFIERQFLSDEFETLINDEVINGATSNPAIFQQAFLNSPAYKEDIEKLRDKTPKEIYETLATKDIKRAANTLKPLYEKGDDGFISIEVDPFLANDVKATVEEGRRLYSAINEPNVMIKIPATEAGYEAMEILISDGININATLIFSPDQANKCLEAFKKGTNSFNNTYAPKEPPKAVISVFVSRFDRKLDKIMSEHGYQKAMIGIINGAKIYKAIQNQELDNVRCLFASTGVKGDDLDPEYYVEKLLYPNAINTAPLGTIHSFIASGKTSVHTVPSDEQIEAFFADLEEVGINMQEVYDELMSEGMVAFQEAFKQILDTLK